VENFDPDTMSGKRNRRRRTPEKKQSKIQDDGGLLQTEDQSNWVDCGPNRAGNTMSKFEIRFMANSKKGRRRSFFSSVPDAGEELEIKTNKKNVKTSSKVHERMMESALEAQKQRIPVARKSNAKMREETVLILVTLPDTSVSAQATHK
jgi:hypothetical protein